MRASIRAASLVAAIGIATLAAPSGAQALGCGQTIVHSIKLTANLDCSASPSDGLTIGRPGITVNLNRYAIIGGGGAEGKEGIIDVTGKDRLTVENGTIRNFEFGIDLDSTAKVKVSHVNFALDGTRTYHGIFGYYVVGSSFLNVKVSNASAGISLYHGSGDTIADTTLSGSTYGIYSEAQAGNRFTRVKSIGVSGTTYGIDSYEDVDAVFAKDVSNGGYYGFYVEAPHGVTISKGRANKNSNAGVYITDNGVPGHRARVINTTADSNGTYGIYAQYSVFGSGNTAVGNAGQNCLNITCHQ